MTINEYTKELAKIRFAINKLAYEMGSTSNSYNLALTQIVNDSLQGNLLIESNAPIELGDRLGNYTDLFKIDERGFKYGNL